MTFETATAIMQQAMLTAIWVGLPLALAAVGAGVILGVVQGALGQSDTTVLVAPKLLAAAVAFIFFGAWMLALMTRFWIWLWTSLPGWLG